MKHKWINKEFDYKLNRKFCTYAECEVCGMKMYYEGNHYGFKITRWVKKDKSEFINLYDKMPKCQTGE